MIFKNSNPSDYYFKSFFIKGIHCASCVYSIEKALSSIKGVKKVSINLITSQATIESDKEVGQEAIKKAIEKVGYQIEFRNNENVSGID